MVERVKRNEQTTEYSHSIKITDQHAKTDCSGLLNHALLKGGRCGAFHEVLAFKAREFPASRKFKRVYSYDYFNLFKAIESRQVQSENWRILNNHAEAKDGDVIVWTPTAEQMQSTPGKPPHGHIAIIEDIQTYQGYAVIKILDSSQTKHYGDSRGENNPGVGSGAVVLYMGKNTTNFNLLKWSGDSGCSHRNIKIARLKER